MKIKKFIALAMAACMSFSMATSVFAADEIGTSSNPEVLTELTGDTVTVTGQWTSYNYNYTIPTDTEGTVGLTVEIEEDHVDTDFSINLENLTTGAYTMQGVDPGYGVYSATIKGNAGDVIKIQVTSYAAEVTVTWTASMATVGTEETPEVIESFYDQPTTMETMLTPGTDGYYYTYTNNYANGEFAIFIDENATIDPHAMYPDIVEDDALLADSMDELKAEITLTNKETNKVVKYSEGTEAFSVTNRYTGMSNTYNIIKIPYKMGEEIVINLSSDATDYADGVKVVFGLFNFEPAGSYSNPYKLSAMELTAEVAMYDAFFVKVNGAYAQFPITVSGEGDFTVTDMFTEEEYADTDNIMLVQNEDTTEYGFYIINMTENDATYEVTVNVPLGDDLNREALDTNDKTEHTFVAGDKSIYHATWTAPEDGIVKFNVAGTNWTYSIENTTSGYYGPDFGSYAEKVTQESVDVKKGDELVIYITAWDKDGAVVEDTKVTTTVEFVATEGGVVDSEVVDDIVNAIGNEDYEAGETVVLDMTEDDEVVATVIPTEVLKAIMEYNAVLAEDGEDPLVLEVVMGDVTWTITDITSAAPVDLSVELEGGKTAAALIETVAKGNLYDTFSIAHEGDFGFKAVITIDIDELFNGKTAKLYWDNNGTLELIDSCVVADAKLNFDMTHASDYVVVIEGTATTDDDTSNEGDIVPGTDADQEVKPGDTANVVMLLLVAAVASVVVLTKKKTVVE